MEIPGKEELLNGIYRRYVAKFGRTFNPLGLSGEIWQVVEVLMLQALLDKGDAVTLERIWKYRRVIRDKKI